MNDLILFLIAVIVGLALGMLFFGGLWWTVKKGVVSKYPALWFLSSFFIRVSVTLFCFYLLAQINWILILFCMVGFLTARIIISRYTQKNIIA